MERKSNREMKARVKGLLAFVLVFMLMFGNSLTVFAAEQYMVPGLSVGDVLQGGDEIILTVSGTLRVYIDNDMIGTVDVVDKSCELPVEGTYKVDKIVVSDDNLSDPNGKIYEIYLITPSAKGSAAKSTDNSKGSGEEHTHTFEWRVVKDPTLKEDGLAQSICRCGEVEAEQPVSSANVFVRLVRDSIRNAPQGGTVEITSELYTCYTAEIIDALIARSDVSLKTTFPAEDGTFKSFTIPAGKAPTDGAEFYGFTGLGNTYGWN